MVIIDHSEEEIKALETIEIIITDLTINKETSKINSLGDLQIKIKIRAIRIEKEIKIEGEDFTDEEEINKDFNKKIHSEEEDLGSNKQIRIQGEKQQRFIRTGRRNRIDQDVYKIAKDIQRKSKMEQALDNYWKKGDQSKNEKPTQEANNEK